MASTFFGLTIAYSGLQAANTSLTITGHNVSNINTKGYTKQQATNPICGKGFTTAAKIPAPAMRYPARRWMTRLLRRSWKKPQSTSAGPMCGAAPARPPPLTVRALSAGCTRPAASTTCPVPRRRAFITSALSFLPPRQSPATLSFSREPMTAPALYPMWGFMWATG